MTQETFEQMFKRIAEETDDGTGEQMFVDTDSWLDAVATRLRDELTRQGYVLADLKGQEPVAVIKHDPKGWQQLADALAALPANTAIYTRPFVSALALELHVKNWLSKPSAPSTQLR